MYKQAEVGKCTVGGFSDELSVPIAAYPDKISQPSMKISKIDRKPVSPEPPLPYLRHAQSKLNFFILTTAQRLLTDNIH